MCGIYGQFNYTDSKPVLKEDLIAPTRKMKHRGPDDEGFYHSGPVGLGFRRLSIIDIQGGHQPMNNEEGSVHVVFNGEIYNFKSLREDLKKLGYKFRTNSDTEVIVHGYSQWGDNVLDRVNGMFGFAVWDEKRKRMLLARDRLGIKPLYYRIDGGKLFFASEMAPLLNDNVSTNIDPLSFNLFLRFRYTPAPLTIYHEINKLGAGEKMVVERGGIKREKWWSFRPEPFDKMPDPDLASEQLLELYSRAVKRQIVSDVPLGLLLSGGVDSALLLGMLKEYGQEWLTYTVGYGSSFKDDELDDAEATAKFFNVQHHSVIIDQKMFQTSLPEIIVHLEEPIASSSIVPMYHVCKKAREKLKVVLVGQGPDEMFGGYKRHLGIKYGHHWRSLPKSLRVIADKVLRHFSESETIHRGLDALNTVGQNERFRDVLSLLPGNSVDQLFHDGLIIEDTDSKILSLWSDIFETGQHADELTSFQSLELGSTLPDELLMYGDKMSMCHGLEARVPYLDHEIVEYVGRLDSSFKVRNGSRKWLHKRVCKQFLPKNIVNRKKRGFAVKVVDKWFTEEVDSKMVDIFLDPHSLIYNFIKHDKAKEMFQQHRSGSRNNHKMLFSLVLMEEWIRASNAS